MNDLFLNSIDRRLGDLQAAYDALAKEVQELRGLRAEVDALREEVFALFEQMAEMSGDVRYTVKDISNEDSPPS